MAFQKKKGYFKFLENHLKNPELQSYYDLLNNFSIPHKTIFKASKNDSLYESVLFAYLEQQILLGSFDGVDTIIKLIDSDTSDIYEWPHWNTHKKSIKTIIFRLKDRMSTGTLQSKETLNYLYQLKENKLELDPQEQGTMNLQNYLNILMRYIIMTHVIVNRETYFANMEVMRRFFESIKLYSLKEGFSEIALGFLPLIFSVNFKLFCWERKDETNNNLYLKKKYFITKDEKWRSNSTICLIQNEDMLSYRYLPSREHDHVFYKKILEDFCYSYNELLRSIVKYYDNYVRLGVSNLKSEFDIFKKKTDPYEFLFYETHDLDDINHAYTKLKNMMTEEKINNHNFDDVIKDFVYEKTVIIENNFKELHGYIQKVNQYSSFAMPESKAIVKANSNDNNKNLLEGKKKSGLEALKEPWEKNYDKYLPNNYAGKKFSGENSFGEEYKRFNQEKIPKPEIKSLNQKEDPKSNALFYAKPNGPDPKPIFQANNYNPIGNVTSLKGLKDQEIFNPNVKIPEINTKNPLTKQNNFHPEEQKFNPTNIQNKANVRPATSSTIQCPICSSDVSVDDNIITLGCEHKICRDCLSGWLMAKYDLGQWDLDNFKCFLPECSKTIDIHILKHIIGDEKFSKISEKLAEKLCVNCPYTDCRFFFMNDIKNQQKIECPKCNRPICPKCNEKFHDTKACPKLLNIAMNALKNEKLNVCPECFEVYLKDDKCAHVKCMKCGTEFCFECSCYRIPTLAHGNHYHRADCKFYFEKEDPKTKKPIKTDEYDPKNCKLCRESGKPCKRPMSYKEFYVKFIKDKK